jgi:hypothetical protein
VNLLILVTFDAMLQLLKEMTHGQPCRSLCANLMLRVLVHQTNLSIPYERISDSFDLYVHSYSQPVSDIGEPSTTTTAPAIAATPATATACIKMEDSTSATTTTTAGATAVDSTATSVKSIVKSGHCTVCDEAPYGLMLPCKHCSVKVHSACLPDHECCA